MPTAPASTSRRLAAFAATAPGVEALCVAELTALGIRARAEEGGASWTGDAESVQRANLWLRTASRVLVRVAEFNATAFFELERRAARIDWAQWLAPGAAVEFRVTCRKSKLYHSDAVAQRFAESVARRVPGAIVTGGKRIDKDGRTQSGKPGGKRSRTPTTAPDDESEDAGDDQAQLFVVRFLHDVCTVSIDSSGALLHLRGYRQAVAKAPMRETLAAAVLLAAGWTGHSPLADPMCGSGTIPIEAALLARRIAPGRSRSFAFERWPRHDADAWRRLVDGACAAEAPQAPIRIEGYDRDAGAIAAARANAERAGVANDVAWAVQPLSALTPAGGSGLLAINPPYGVRVGEARALRNLYAQIGNTLRAARPGWSLAMLSADRALEAQVHTPFVERLRTTNGGIPVRVIVAKSIADAAGERPSSGD